MKEREGGINYSEEDQQVKSTDKGTEMEYYFFDEHKKAEARLEYKTEQLQAIRM